MPCVIYTVLCKVYLPLKCLLNNYYPHPAKIKIHNTIYFMLSSAVTVLLPLSEAMLACTLPPIPHLVYLTQN